MTTASTVTEERTELLRPSVRIAKKEDYLKIVEIAKQAFLHDPLINYFSNLSELRPVDFKGTQTEEGLDAFFWFILRACQRSKGRITVVVAPQPDGTETVLAASLWLPPGKRISTFQIRKLIRSGIFKVTKAWGIWRCMMRLGIEYGNCEAVVTEGYKAKGAKEKAVNAWYLMLTMTHPDHQGRGCMSMLIREAYVHAPGQNFTLEATTAKSRDQYTHLGFEVIKPITFGRGKATYQGLRATGATATGFEIYSMVNWAATD